ncbi:HIT domain-containing protein [Synechococcus sp. ATX 2A4]|uniref:HIT domain-containing protein n=1 Tax=Synechococcus sp. ATX 2A4 TaxID=2823727 RepID=UPI0020CCFCD7|nr:HIT domain-containing protein [Synechococcus sp. ATX 2A4]MCP9883722.1 HIT domain-containing protein [Synechococcus sp. ATX 2A4]
MPSASTPISGSVKDRVLTRARGRYECCGAHEHQRALEVDPIIPKNQGGSDAISNLQALCFRGVQASDGHRETGCVFCALEGSGRMLLENELALCIADAYPVSEGHSLVIPRRHGAYGLELHQQEWNAVVKLLKLRREQLSAQAASISGWAGLLNARGGLNSGEVAGQTVFHAHWHLIPRRKGDDDSPRGGGRGVIEGKQHY